MEVWFYRDSDLPEENCKKKKKKKTKLWDISEIELFAVNRDPPVLTKPEGGALGCTGPVRPQRGAAPGWVPRPSRRYEVS